MMVKVLDPEGKPYYITRFAVDLTQLELTEIKWQNMIRHPYTQEFFKHGGIPVVGYRDPSMSIEEFMTIRPDHVVGYVQNEPSLLADAGSVRYGHNVKSVVSTVDVRWLPEDTTDLTRLIYHSDITYPGCFRLVPRLFGYERLICFDVITTSLDHIRHQRGLIELDSRCIIDPGLRDQVLKMSDEEIFEIMNMSPEEAMKRLRGYSQVAFSFAAGFIQGEKDDENQE